MDIRPRPIVTSPRLVELYRPIYIQLYSPSHGYCDRLFYHSVMYSV